MRHHGVAVRPIVAIVAAIGVRIARPEVLTICVRVELRTIAGVFDNGLRQRGSCESHRGKSSGTYYSEFHSGLLDHFGLLDGISKRWERAFHSPVRLFVRSFKRDNPAPRVDHRPMVRRRIVISAFIG